MLTIERSVVLPQGSSRIVLLAFTGPLVPRRGVATALAGEVDSGAHDRRGPPATGGVSSADGRAGPRGRGAGARASRCRSGEGREGGRASGHADRPRAIDTAD